MALGSFYGAWFLAVALAAGAARRFEAVRRFTARRARVLLALYPVGAALGLALLAGARMLAGVPPWAPVPPGVILAGGLLAALPVGAVTGVLFPALCDAVAANPREGASTGYVWEAAGSVLGGLAAAGMFLLGVDGPSSVAAAGLVATGAAWPWRSRPGPVDTRWVPGVATALCLAVLVPPSGPAIRDALSDLRLRANLAGASRVDEVSTPHGLITTAHLGPATVVLADGGVLMAAPPGPEEAVEAALLAVQPARQDRAILLGAGRFSLAISLARIFRQVEVVATDEGALAALRTAWEAAVGPVPPNVSFTVEDPRARVRRATEGAEFFDLAVIAVGEPRTLNDNRLHTVDFDRELREVLAPGGVVSSSFRSGENVLGPEVLRYGRSMRASLGEAFAFVAAVPGDEALLLASADPGRVTVDRAELEERVRALGAGAAGVEPAAVAERARPDRTEWLRRLLEAPEGREAQVNRDDRPVATFLSLLATLRMSGTGGLGFLWGARQAGPWLPAGLLVILVLLGVRERLRSGDAPGSVAAPVLLACAGGASIAASVVLLAAWRARIGSLYGEVGLASSAVMIGLYLGALAGRPVGRGNARKQAAIFCLSGASILLAAPWLLDATADASPAVIRATLLGLLLLSGALAGAAWPLAAHLGTADRASQRLEAADHVGAALGSALSGVVGLAILGIDGTLRMLAGTLGVALVLVILDWVLDAGPGRRFLSSGIGRRLSFRSFPWPGLTVVGGVILLAATWTWHAARPTDAGPRTRLTEEELRGFERSDLAEWRDSPFGHHRLSGVREPAGEAVVLATGAAGAGVEGYGGAVDLALSVGSDGAIRRVEVLAHRETPAYVKDLPAWVQRFRGMDVRSLAAGGEGAVDAMTGATVTSRAILGTLAQATRRVGGEVLGLPMPPLAPARPWHAPLGDPGLWYAVVALAGAVLVHLRGSARIRLGFLLASGIIGGAILQVQLSAGWLLSWLRLDPTSFEAAPAVAVLGAGFLGLSVLWGPVHCAHVCPYGALQEGVSLVGRRLGLAVRMPDRVHRTFRAVKYGVLVAVALVLFAPVPDARLAWDPLAAAFSGRIEGAAGLLVALSLAGSLFTFRFWCRGFCPVGAFFNLFNRAAAVLGRVPPRRHAACDLGVRGPGDGDCLQCNRCVRGTGLERAGAPVETP